MFFSAAERAFALLHAMLTRRATHQSVFVDARFNLFRFHCYNIPRKPSEVKGYFHKVIHNETQSHFAAPPAPPICQVFFRHQRVLSIPNMNTIILIINTSSIIRIRLFQYKFLLPV